MKEKNYVCRDGNGKYIFDKTSVIIALITLFILIATVFASIVAYSVNAQSDIEINKEQISKLTKQSEEYEKRITAIETHYIHILNSLERIEKKIEG